MSQFRIVQEGQDDSGYVGVDALVEEVSGGLFEPGGLISGWATDNANQGDITFGTEFNFNRAAKTYSVLTYTGAYELISQGPGVGKYVIRGTWIRRDIRDNMNGTGTILYQQGPLPFLATQIP